MAYKAVIFDLDGTLLDTLEDLHASVTAALEANGMPARSVDEVRAALGFGARELIRRCVPAGTRRRTVYQPAEVSSPETSTRA